MFMNPARAIINPRRTALLVCDVQEKFAKVIFGFDKMVSNSLKLVKACKILNIPIIVTEQNPKALGKTVCELDLSCNKSYSKTQFSMWIPEVCQDLCTSCGDGPATSILLLGIEAHACIENTAIDFRDNGYEVHTIADCCSSRTQEDRLLALQRMHQIGCHISTSENVIFKILKNSNHEHFRDIQCLIKDPTKYTGLVHNCDIE